MDRSERRAVARALALAAAAAIVAGCGGGASLPGASVAGGARTASVRIFFPRAAARGAAAAVARRRASPAYLSTATQGITIVTTDPSDHIVDSEAFSTNLDDRDCVASTAPNAIGNVCTFVVGAVPGTTTFSIATYDGEPTDPSGDPANVYHALNAKPLSTATVAETIAPGTSNSFAIALGGVIAAFALTSTSAAIGDLANGAVVTFGGQGTVQTVPLGVSARDADGRTIAAGPTTPYANPISLSVAETGDGGHTKLVLATTDADGTVVVGTPSTTVTITHSSDTIAAVYDGGAISTASTPYSAAIIATSARYTEPTSDAVVAASASQLTLAPIFVQAQLDNAPGAFYGDPVGGTPTFTLATPPLGSTAIPKIQIDNAGLASTQATNPVDPQEDGTAVDLRAGGSPCAAFTLTPEPHVAGRPQLDDIVVDGSHPGAVCRFAVGDGTSPGQTVELDAG